MKEHVNWSEWDGRYADRTRTETAQGPAEKVCADCGGKVGTRPVWMAQANPDLCMGCVEELGRAERQAKLWAQDQLGGKDAKRGRLAGIFRLRQEILFGDPPAEWIAELHKAIAFVWEYVVHDWNVARKGACR